MLKVDLLMARNNKKNKRRSYRGGRSVPKLLGLAEAGVMANAGTKFFFDVDAWTFVSKGWFDQGVKGGTSSTGAYGHSWELTLYELITNPSGTWGGKASSVQQMGGLGGMIKANMKSNMNAGATLLLAPIGFRILRRVMRKPIRVSNKVIADVVGKNVVKI